VKFVYQTVLLGLVATGLMLAPARPVIAQSAGQPAMVISMAGMGEQLNDVQYLMDKAGQGAMYGMVQGQANVFLNGLDRSRAMGALLFFSDDSPEPQVLGMVPVKNLDDVLDTIAGFAEVDENGDTFEITPRGGGETVLVREKGGYAFICDNADLFDMIPADPAEVLSAVSSDYNVGAKVFVQRIPEGLREMALSGIEEGYRESIDQMGDEDMAELQSQNFEMQMKKMRSLINETEELVAGLNIDKDGGNIHIDMQMIGQDGSELARQSESYNSGIASRFAGFAKTDAAINMNFSGTVNPEDAEEGKQQLDRLVDLANKKMDEENVGGSERELLNNVITDLISVLKKTMDEGKMDMGAMAMVDENNANLVAGMQVADPAKVEKSVRDLVAAAEGKTDGKATFNLDMGSHDGVNLHEIIVDVSNDEQAVNLFGGDEAKIYLGVGDKAIYFGAGNAPLDLLKSAISDKTASNSPAPMQMNMHLAPIMRKVGAMQGQDMAIDMADKLASSGRDRIGFVMNGIKNGIDMRIEIEDGLLELIGMAAQMGMGGGPGRADF
jgi:hypothetical protein